MFNSIFGALGQSALSGMGYHQNNPSALQNGYSQQMNNQLAQQQMAQYNQAFEQPKWIINGQRFKNSAEFALHIWPDDEQARLMFCLKYPI